MKVGTHLMPLTSATSSAENALGEAWMIARTKLRELGRKPLIVYRGTLADYATCARILIESVNKSATATRKISEWIVEVRAILKNGQLRKPSNRAVKKQSTRINVAKKGKKKGTTKRKRPVPPEARDPAHSLKCDPNIRADQVFIPLNLAEVEACPMRSCICSWSLEIAKAMTASRTPQQCAGARQSGIHRSGGATGSQT